MVFTATKHNTKPFKSQSSHRSPSVSSDAILHEAYSWLCDTRKNTHHNNDVWDLRFHWQQIKAQIQHELINDTYRFLPCKNYYIDGKSIGVWNAQDALVLKAMSIVLTNYLSPKLSPNCYHLVGRSGTKFCVMNIKNVAPNYRYVCRSDINSNYATITTRP